MPAKNHEYFISCDWGSTRLRLRLVGINPYRVLDECVTREGAAQVAGNAPLGEKRRKAFSDCLRRTIRQLRQQTACDLNNVPVVASGMVTSSYGWRDLPYATLPIPLDGQGLVTATESIKEIEGTRNVHLVSGLRDQNDVIRGEECELMGLSATDTWKRYAHAQNATVVMPGTHSKHVAVRESTITGFTTFMTGELYDVLARHSVLRHSLPTDAEGHGPVPEGPFRHAVRRVAQTSMQAALFTVRSRSLLQNATPRDNAGFLRGILIGAELVALRNASAPGSPVVLCAGTALANTYRIAAEELQMDRTFITVPPEEVDSLATRGHAKLFTQWRHQRGRNPIPTAGDPS